LRRKNGFFLSALLLLIAAGSSSATPFAINPETAVGPTITTQPASVAVKLGATATFTVVASGTAPLSYQWYNSHVGPISGATTAKYTLPATTGLNNGEYFYVLVSNSVNAVSSNQAYLTIADPPVFEEQPRSQTVTVPGVAEFDAYAYANGGPLTCQWYKNGKAISGATNCDSYVTEETTVADNGAAFTAIATDLAGSVKSRTAILTVNAATTAGTYPIVGNWSGTATITNAGSKTTSQAVAAFSQNSYSLTGTIVYTDDSGIPTYGVGVASLNGQNLYVVAAGDGTGGIAGGFAANLLTLNLTGGGGQGNEAEFGSGSLALSSDHNTLTGTGKDSDGDTISWKLTREK